MSMRRQPSSGLALAAGSFLYLYLVLGSNAAPVSGQGRHLGQEKKAHGEQAEHEEGEHHERDKPRHAYRFGAHEREVISGYYAGQSSGLPPGLAKRGGNLPPGLEKHLERYGTLPPGLQKRLEPLPVELERQLPPLPPGCGCQRGIIGTSVLLVRSRDGFILDVFHLGGR